MGPKIRHCLSICLYFIWFADIAYAQSTAAPECGFDRNMVHDEVIYTKVSQNNHRDVFHFRSTLTIPVVFHIVTDDPGRISDEMIHRQLSYLNRDFQGMNRDREKVPEIFKERAGSSSIRFCLAGEDFYGTPTLAVQRVKTTVPDIGIRKELYHTVRGGSDAWNTSRYLNIWIADTGSGISGLGSAPGQRNMDEDGVIIHPDLFDRSGPSRTLTHEVGHYLGLFHMWNADGSCVDMDFVEDTPVQAYPYYDCPRGERVTCGSPDMYMNFMDYTDPECQFFFTKGQVIRMEQILVEYRPQLLMTATNCEVRKDDPDYIIYPNPVTDGHLNIRFQDETSLYIDIRIFDITGQQVYEQQAWAIGETTLQTGLLQVGVYIILINGAVRRFVVL